jgi:hypothetical protein
MAFSLGSNKHEPQMSEETFLPRAGPIKETFVASKWFRNMMTVACLALCGGIELLWWLIALRGGGGAVVQLGAMAFLALIAVLLAAHLFFCWRHRLYLCEDGLASRGLGATTEVAFADVVQLKWWPESPGAATLSTNISSFRINFVRYRPVERLQVIRALRQAIPTSEQQDWNLFCVRVALPLRNPAGARSRHPVVLPRFLLDRTCFWLMAAELAFAVLNWVLVGFPGDWTITVLPWAITGFVWMAARPFVPVRYRIRIHSFPAGFFVETIADFLASHVRLMALIVFCVLGLVVAPRIPGLLEVAIAVLVVDAVIGFVSSQLNFWREFKGRRREDLEESVAAMRAWDALEGELTAAPLGV